jgi:lysophospholipase L1-like esterase
MLGILTAFVLLFVAETVLRIAQVEFSWEVDAPLAREQLRPYLGKGELWSDEKALAVSFSIYDDHRTRLWRLRGGLSRELSNFLTPRDYRDKTRFWVETNSDGFRAEADFKPSRPGIFRVACFGDSHVFGWGVGRGEAFPARLAELLGSGNRDVEVLNFGQPGYSSFQGLTLFMEAVKHYAFDAVVFCLGFNDTVRAEVPDTEHHRRRTSLGGRLTWMVGRLRLVGLARSLLSRRGGRSVGKTGPRVSAEEYRRHLAALGAACRGRGLRAVFLSLYNGYSRIMREEAGRAGHTYLDGDALARTCLSDLLHPPDEQTRAARLCAESTFDAPFLERHPKYLTHVDAAHYSAFVHRRLARELARALLPSRLR